MPFPDPDERPSDERNLKLEFALLLAFLIAVLIAGAYVLFGKLSAML
jgi:uncharacterized protein (UPF0333 family)